MNNSIIHKNNDSVEICYNEQIKYLLEMFFQTRYTIYKKICNHKTVRSLEIMMGEVLKLIENTFNINKSIHDKDWNKFCIYSDITVFSLDFLSDQSKDTDEGYKLYQRIKNRKQYKLIDQFEDHDSSIMNDKKIYRNYKDNHIINRSMIKFYSDEYPILLNEKNKIVCQNFFDDTNKNLYLVKIYEK
tara:strand:+ start:9 stop:569 length:561 start_codon:yes stop_codon:yes gene_type:complete